MGIAQKITAVFLYIYDIFLIPKGSASSVLSFSEAFRLLRNDNENPSRRARDNVHMRYVTNEKGHRVAVALFG